MTPYDQEREDAIDRLLSHWPWNPSDHGVVLGATVWDHLIYLVGRVRTLEDVILQDGGHPTVARDQ